MLSDFKKDQITKSSVKKTVTIEQVKSCIAMSETFLSNLRGLCDCWYKIAIGEGKTEAEAAEIALDKLGKKMLAMSK